MVFSITNIYEMLTFPINVAHALGVMELNLVVLAIDKANLTITYNVQALHSLLIDYHDSIISAIRYQHHIVWQVLLSLNTNDFAWVPQILRFGIFYLLRCLLHFLCLFLSLNLFLLLWLNIECLVVIQMIKVKIICHRYKQVKNLSHSLTV